MVYTAYLINPSHPSHIEYTGQETEIFPIFCTQHENSMRNTKAGCKTSDFRS